IALTALMAPIGLVAPASHMAPNALVTLMAPLTAVTAPMALWELWAPPTAVTAPDMACTYMIIAREV
ncbi:MAG: hypothetical protein FWH55_03055, partial [Oscillospiraceae bacterium]|nr:hypothetical protein [Oscillospiraceae bacterium]